MFKYILMILFLGFPLNVEPQRRSFSFATYTKPCEMPRLKNGIVRLRQRGRFVTYNCKPTFAILGNKHSACTNGKWDAPVPACIKGGCPPVEEPEHSVVLEQFSYSTLTLFCHTGYQRIGAVKAFCDGKNWDRPLGSCREISMNAESSCDFEGEDLCGWTHDNTNEYVWKRSNGMYQGKLLMVGPTFDHTAGKIFEGYFMLLDMSEVTSGERARIISPAYSSNHSTNACFKMFYHMYGLSPGKLRVYAKPLEVDLEDALSNSSYKVFEISGNQGNQWNEKVFKIPEFRDEFQMIVEGVATMMYGSHIAVDDLALLQGNDCIVPLENATETKDSIFSSQSCSNRCEETETTIKGSRLIINPDFTITTRCDCFDGCNDIGTCCADYRSICVDIEVVTPDEEAENDAIDPVTTASTKRSSTSSTTVPTTTKTTTIRSTTTTRSTTTSTTTTTTTPSTTTQRRTTPSTTTQRKTTSSTTKRTTTKIPTTTQSSTTTLKSAATTKAAHNSSDYNIIEDNVDYDDEIPPTVTPSTSKSNPHKYVAPEQPEDNFILYTVTMTIVAFICIIVASGIVVYIRRKRFDPRNYKQNSAEGTENATDEFSEVRFLTCDEQLDFTPQTPLVESKNTNAKKKAEDK